MPVGYLCLALVLMACRSDSRDEPVPIDAAIAGDGEQAADASIDGNAMSPDAMPGLFTLRLTPGSGGSISASVDSISIGSCAQTETCDFLVDAEATVLLSSNQGTLRHCSWTGSCTGFGVSTSCILLMDQNHSAGAKYDVIDADCP